jgi:glycerate kinase
VLKAVAAKQVRRCVVGIGGSATNDGGFGLVRALGWKFVDKEGKSIERWTELTKVRQLSAPKKRKLFNVMQVAVDVRNPLLGPKGATSIYGPQKGVRPQDFAFAEECLAQLARVTEEYFGQRFDKEPGTGAAGGLGFGLRAFLGASLEPGFDLFEKEAGLDEELQKADLVLTGEGAIDESTFMGKGVGELARLCQRLKIPCFALVGNCERKSQKQFAQVLRLTDITSREQALKRAGYWLERLTEKAARSEVW